MRKDISQLDVCFGSLQDNNFVNSEDELEMGGVSFTCTKGISHIEGRDEFYLDKVAVIGRLVGVAFSRHYEVADSGLKRKRVKLDIPSNESFFHRLRKYWIPFFALSPDIERLSYSIPGAANTSQFTLFNLLKLPFFSLRRDWKKLALKGSLYTLKKFMVRGKYKCFLYKHKQKSVVLVVDDVRKCFTLVMECKLAKLDEGMVMMNGINSVVISLTKKRISIGGCFDSQFGSQGKKCN